MKKFLRSTLKFLGNILLVITSLLLLGLAYLPAIWAERHLVTDEAFSRLQKGMRAQVVEAMLGPPADDTPGVVVRHDRAEPEVKVRVLRWRTKDGFWAYAHFDDFGWLIHRGFIRQ